MPINQALANILMDELVEQDKVEKSPDRPSKDILIVVHNQLEYTKKCLTSIVENTSDYNLHVWNNGSDKETEEWLESFGNSLPPVVGWSLTHVPENMGFIEPNNEMVSTCKGDYLILLNNDTEVGKGWDTALIGWLMKHPKYGVVGYEGGLVSSNGVGIGVGFGEEIDYVAGWCLCMSRDLYMHLGLFDMHNLKFAYGEDLDLGLRVREAGFRNYALHLKYVKHHANRTTSAIKDTFDLKPMLKANHLYIQTRWKDYLANQRVLLKYPDLDREATEMLNRNKMLPSPDKA